MAFDQKAYNAAYYAAHADGFRQRAHDWYHARKDDPAFQERRALQREKQHFGVPRSVIFRKTDGCCYLCGKPADIVHHLQEDGRTHEAQKLPPGHDPEQLIGVCRACHIDLHRMRLQTQRKTRANGYWSRTYTACIACGTTATPHKGHGLCQTCTKKAASRQRKAGGV